MATDTAMDESLLEMKESLVKDQEMILNMRSALIKKQQFERVNALKKIEECIDELVLVIDTALK